MLTKLKTPYNLAYKKAGRTLTCMFGLLQPRLRVCLAVRGNANKPACKCIECRPYQFSF